MQDAKSIVSNRDALNLLKIIHECAKCVTGQDAHAIMQKTDALIGSNKAGYGLAQLASDGSIVYYNAINFSNQIEWFDIYKNIKSLGKDQVSLGDISFINLHNKDDNHGNGNVGKKFKFLHGHIPGKDELSKAEQCRSSATGDIENQSRTEYILANLSTHLHAAFNNVLRRQYSPKVLQVSTREKEVLNWIKHGKSNLDISVILDISERTVKFHIDNILKKLDALNRSHAVAIGLSSGLIDFV